MSEKTISRSTANSGTIPVGGELPVTFLASGLWARRATELGLPENTAYQLPFFAAPSKLGVNFKNTPASWRSGSMTQGWGGVLTGDRSEPRAASVFVEGSRKSN
jgi:hypothetical protein